MKEYLVLQLIVQVVIHAVALVVFLFSKIL